MRRLSNVLLFLCLALVPSVLHAQFSKLQGWCEDGNKSVTIPGTQGSGNQKFQQSYPSCTVTVYDAGTVNLSTIYRLSTGGGTANPFTAAASGQWFFYGQPGQHYDVKFSNGGIPVPFTLGDQVAPTTNTAVLNPLDFGAKCDGTTDDTAGINATIAAAKVLAGGSSSSFGAVIQFPVTGHQCHVSSLNATDFYGLTMQGNTTQGVIICGDRQTVSGKPILDLTGSSAVILSGFVISTCGVPATLPTVGVLWAAAISPASSCNKNRMDNVGVTGSYSVAAVYVYACTDSITTGSAWQSQKDGTPVLYFNDDNSAGVVSPYVTINTGTQPSGDWTLIQQELHDLGVNSGSSASFPMTIRGSDNIRYYGGIIAGSGSAVVKFTGHTPKNMTFDGIKVYGDNGTQPANVFYCDTAMAVQNLIIRNVYSNSGPILRGEAGCTFRTLDILYNADLGTVGTIQIANATPASTVTIQDARIDALGAAFTPGGSVKNVILQNPGAITLQAGATWDNVIPAATFTFAAKPSFSIAGSSIFISDGVLGSNPCVSGGTGAIATYQNSALSCGGVNGFSSDVTGNLIPSSDKTVNAGSLTNRIQNVFIGGLGFINHNASTAEPSTAGLTPVLHLASANSTAESLLWDSFATNNSFLFRRAEGTSASPSAIAAPAEDLGHIGAGGYGTSYTGIRAVVEFKSLEAWNGTNQGAGVWLECTPTGSTTPQLCGQFQKGFILDPAGLLVDEGTGTANVKTGYYLNNTSIVDSSGDVKPLGGTNIVYRCATAGMLRAGALTIVAGDCGTTVDTGLRVP